MTKQKNPKTYVADRDVYVGHQYHKAGHPFVTADEPADFWKEVDEQDAQIDQASLDKVPGDTPIEGLTLPALQALAATKNVNTTGMNKQKLIDAIKAANEPAL